MIFCNQFKYFQKNKKIKFQKIQNFNKLIQNIIFDFSKIKINKQNMQGPPQNYNQYGNSQYQGQTQPQQNQYNQQPNLRQDQFFLPQNTTASSYQQPHVQHNLPQTPQQQQYLPQKPNQKGKTNRNGERKNQKYDQKQQNKQKVIHNTGSLYEQRNLQQQNNFQQQQYQQPQKQNNYQQKNHKKPQNQYQEEPQFQKKVKQQQYNTQYQNQPQPQYQPQPQPQAQYLEQPQPQYQAQPQPQYQAQPQPQYQPQPQPQLQYQAQPQPQYQGQPQYQPQIQPSYQQQYPPQGPPTYNQQGPNYQQYQPQPPYKNQMQRGNNRPPMKQQQNKSFNKNNNNNNYSHNQGNYQGKPRVPNSEKTQQQPRNKQSQNKNDGNKKQVQNNQNKTKYLFIDDCPKGEDCFINNNLKICKYKHDLPEEVQKEIIEENKITKEQFIDKFVIYRYKYQLKQVNIFNALDKDLARKQSDQIMKNWEFINPPFLINVITKLGMTRKTEESVYQKYIDSLFDYINKVTPKPVQNLVIEKQDKEGSFTPKINVQRVVFEISLILSSFLNCEKLRNQFFQILKDKIPALLPTYEKKLSPKDENIENEDEEGQGGKKNKKNKKQQNKKWTDPIEYTQTISAYRQVKSAEMLEIRYKVKNMKSQEESEQIKNFCALEAKYHQYDVSRDILLEQLDAQGLKNYGLSIYKRYSLYYNSGKCQVNKKIIAQYKQLLNANSTKIVENKLINPNEDAFQPAEKILQTSDCSEYVDFSDYGINYEDVSYFDCINENSQEFQFMKQHLLSQKTIGLDSEGYGIFLLQIASSTKIFIIDFWKIGFQDVALNNFLKQLFEAKVLKVGQDVTSDISEIMEKINVSVKPLKYVLNVNQVFKNLYCDELKTTKSSLLVITENIIKKKLSKIDQMSNWKIRPLTARQIHYSGMDAFIPLKIYEIFKKDKQGLLNFNQYVVNGNDLEECKEFQKVVYKPVQVQPTTTTEQKSEQNSQVQQQQQQQQQVQQQQQQTSQVIQEQQQKQTEQVQLPQKPQVVQQQQQNVTSQQIQQKNVKEELKLNQIIDNCEAYNQM